MVGDYDFFYRLHHDKYRWCYRHLHERIRHAVDVKVDDILDEHGHIHKDHVQKLLQNTHMLL